MFLKLLCCALRGATCDLKGQTWTHEQYQAVISLAKEQALAGLVSQALIDSGVKLENTDALEVFTLQQKIRNRNTLMDKAVVQLCRKMEQLGVRIFVMKGQTLAVLYPDSGLRQSGDVDFLCYPDDWDKAIGFFRSFKNLDITENTTEKHVSFNIQGVEYELHRKLTAFAAPSHRRYWEEVVMPEVWGAVASVKIEDYAVPTLSPVHNTLYVFVHSFAHLLDEGVGLRQFSDWAKTLEVMPRNEKDIATLERHLEGIGLRKAFSGFGAILTDYLGFPEESFPFEITADDHKRAPELFENMLEMGNFGHNKQFTQHSGVSHGLQHLGRITLQARRFYHYAPAEVWWKIPYMFNWWAGKIWRIISNK